MSLIGSGLRLFTHARADFSVAAELGLQLPIPVIRHVAFASLVPGTGCTTVSSRLTEVLASRRDNGVVWVNAASAASAMQPPSFRPGVGSQALPQPVWPGGLLKWQNALAQHHEPHEIVLTDWGVLKPSMMLEVCDSSHVLCLTTTPEREQVQLALDVANFLAQRDVQVMVIASATERRATVGQERMLEGLPLASALMPHDTTAAEREPAKMAAKSLLSYAKLGADVLRLSAELPLQEDTTVVESLHAAQEAAA